VAANHSLPTTSEHAMNWIERKVVNHMVKALVNRIFGQWKSSATGTVTTVAIITIVLSSYKPGMTWSEWCAAFIPMLVGWAIKDDIFKSLFAPSPIKKG
jgi:hypothetical protein